MRSMENVNIVVIYSDKAWVFDQSERAQGPIYILKCDKTLRSFGNTRETLVVFSYAGRVLSQCNTRLRLLYLLSNTRLRLLHVL